MTHSPFDADRGPDLPRGPRRRRGAGRGRRNDPNATVPEPEFQSYYGRHIVNPPPWEEGVPLYIWLGGMAAGSALMAAGGHMTGRETLKSRNRWASLGILGVGAVALVTDLGRPERFLNMMRTVKLTSPMSVGSWILTGFGTFAGAAVGVEALKLVWTPTGAAKTALTIADPVISFGAAFFAPPLAAYTGVLLGDTAVPLWHEAYHELPFIFVSSGTAAGAGVAQIITPASENGPVRALAALGATADLVADWQMGRRLGEHMGKPLHEGHAGRLHRAARLLTAGGALGSLLLGRWRAGAAVSGAALIAGSFCTRFSIFDAGMESARNPEYIVVPQRERAAAARAEGRGATQPGGDWPADPKPGEQDRPRRQRPIPHPHLPHRDGEAQHQGEQHEHDQHGRRQD